MVYQIVTLIQASYSMRIIQANFKHLRSLYDEQDNFKLYENGKNLNDTIRGIDIVKDAYIHTMFDNVSNQIMGAFGNTVIQHDIINKTLNTTEYGYTGSLVADAGKYNTMNRLSFMSGNYNSAQSNKWGHTTQADKQLFNNYNLVLTVYGNSNITCGTTVQYEMLTNMIGTDGQKHRIFPRKHLVTDCKVTIIDGVYMTTIECSSPDWSI